MIDRVQDAEEKVRAALCRVFGQLDYETALHHIDVQSLKAIGNRSSDKKVSCPRMIVHACCQLAEI
jgi:sister-chromatid-cohesion protein PDS5